MLRLAVTVKSELRFAVEPENLLTFPKKTKIHVVSEKKNFKTPGKFDNIARRLRISPKKLWKIRKNCEVLKKRKDHK